MKLTIDSEFAIICEQIKKEGKSENEWAKLAQDEMFLSPKYSGGYNRTTNLFHFSYYNKRKGAYEFELSLQDVLSVADGVSIPIDINPKGSN